MSLQLLDLILNWGRILGVVPTDLGNLSGTPRYSIVYSATLAITLTVGMAVSYQYKDVMYRQLTDLQMVNSMFNDATLYLLLVYGYLVCNLLKRRQWCKLLNRLSRIADGRPSEILHSNYVHQLQISSINGHSGKIPHSKLHGHKQISSIDGHSGAIPHSKYHHQLQFAAIQLFFMGPLIYSLCTWMAVIGFERLKHYVIVLVELYYQHFFSAMISVILLIMKREFIRLRSSLMKFLEHSDNMALGSFLKKLEEDFCSLKLAIDAFNDLFGWPVVLLIVNVSLSLLHTLSDIFNEEEIVIDRFVWHMSANICMMVVILVGIFTVICCCDSTVKEAKKLVQLSHRLYYLPNIDGDQVEQFVELLSTKLPSFSAAGFFEVNKKVVLPTLTTVFTFLIICIQFTGNFIR